LLSNHFNLYRYKVATETEVFLLDIPALLKRCPHAMVGLAQVESSVIHSLKDA
jgi:hypothetical protein